MLASDNEIPQDLFRHGALEAPIKCPYLIVIIAITCVNYWLLYHNLHLDFIKTDLYGLPA